MRYVPNYKRACMYSLRGMVESHGVHESGWWIFKEKKPVIRVRLNESQLDAFNEISRTKLATMDGYLKGLQEVLEVDTMGEDSSKFPIGQEIGITFGYLPLVEQFFGGARALTLMNLQIAYPGIQLENEILAAT